MHYDKQNIFLVLFVQITQIFLLWFASQQSGWWLVLSAVLFSFIGLTNYALIHEACHSSLHQNKRLNDILGMISGCLFPVSFSFMSIAHKVHHLNNRTDNEMFDYYYPEDNLFIKYAQWYSILMGLYPPVIPIGSILMASISGIFWMKPWQTAKSSSIIFNRQLFPASLIQKIRIEVVFTFIYWMLLFYLLNLSLYTTLILFVSFWFNWSTRQYVTHAFSKRSVLDGAHNLKVSRLMACVFLNGHWDLVHHQYPNARWQEMPKLGEQSRSPIAYWPQYFKQWLGPRANFEAAPLALKDVY